MRLSILVAVSRNGVIGRDNQLLWHLPDDLKMFKSRTLGHPIVMGRKTFESIGRVLPGRTSIVMTRSGTEMPEGVLRAASLTEALGLVRELGVKEAFIIGGAEIYRQALAAGVVDTIYLTRVHVELEGDAFFELPDESAWEVCSQSFHPADANHAYAFDFIELTSVRNKMPLA